MRQLFILIVFLPILSCTENKNVSEALSPAPKTVEVEINRTLETFMILRSIAQEDPLFQYRDSTYLGKPILYEARQFFKNFKNHPAVERTQNLLKSTSGTGDMILQGLLYFDDLPATQQRFEIDSEYWKTNRKELVRYIEMLNLFYKEANVARFIESHKTFYEHAQKEAQSYLDSRLVATLENYFGMENHAYKMILIPNSPFGMGFGASVNSDSGRIFYQIISPANDIQWNLNSSYTTYGFAGEGAKEYYRDMLVHEFCHPFVTPFINTDSMRAEIAKTDSLYVPLLDSAMAKQGYNSWWGFVNEHLVRLGELRVAKALQTEDFEEMRMYNIENSGFILLPEAEELVLEYENNRNRYPTFHDFIPVLIQQLPSFNQQQITNRMKEITLKNSHSN